jgi:hypothetical protein
MELQVVSLIADVATTGATLFAAGGLWLTWRALAAQKRSADLENLLALTNSAREAEERLHSASSPEKLEQEIVNYFNFVEVYSAAVNRGLLDAVTYEIAKDRLINDLAILSVSNKAREHLETVITSAETFSEIHQFWKSNSASIQAAIKREALRASVPR